MSDTRATVPPTSGVTVIPTLGAEVNTGEIYVFLVNIETRSEFNHLAGDLLRVVTHTFETPNNEITDKDVNWVCQSRNERSVWATLEACIARGYLRKLDLESVGVQIREVEK